MNQLSNSLTRLFSGFKSRGDEETAKFQKSVFLALLPPPEWELFHSVKKLDLAGERRALIEVFESFGVSQVQYETAVQQQFEQVGTATENKKSYTNEELMALAAMWSIHRVVQEWGQLGTRQAEIYKPREDFLAVINEMLHRKKLVRQKSFFNPPKSFQSAKVLSLRHSSFYLAIVPFASPEFSLAGRS